MADAHEVSTPGVQTGRMEMLDFARRGRTAGWLYAVTAILALVVWLIIVVAVAGVLAISHQLPPDFAQQLTRPTRPAVFLGANGLMFASLLVAFGLAAHLVQKRQFMDIVGAWSWRLFGLGALVWTAALILMTLADLAIAPSGFRLTASGATLWLTLWSVAALAPQTFTEEFIFRGFLTQGLLLAFKRPWPAAVVSGLIFGAVHIPNGWPQAASALVFGILAARLAIRFGGIAFTFGLHLVNNLFGAVVVVSQSDVFRGLPGAFSQTTPQLLWWDTATMALSLGVVTAVALRRNHGRRSSAAG
jgi:uncharacterized protein